MPMAHHSSIASRPSVLLLSILQATRREDSISRHRINRYSYTTLQMPEDVIGRVHKHAMTKSADVDNRHDEIILDYDESDEDPDNENEENRIMVTIDHNC